MTDAVLDRFRDACRDPDAAVRAALAAGRRPIRTVGVDVPFDLLRACGFQPVELITTPRPTPLADTAIGATGSSAKGRALLEALLAPASADVPVVITSGEAEQFQIFATLREMARLGDAAPAPVHLLDLCHQGRESSDAYNRARLDGLREWLGGLGGGDALAITDEHRDLLARAETMRRDGRLTGAAVACVTTALTILPPDEHRELLAELVAACASLPVRTASRFYLTGSRVGPDLYEAIEALGATIVGEFFGGAVPLGAIDPRDVGRRVADDARACGASRVLHVTIGSDEAAPWTVAPTVAALDGIPLLAVHDDALDKVDRFLRGEPEPASDAVAQGARPPRPAPAADRSRSRKSLGAVADFGVYQREWFAGVRRRAAEGEPFAVVNANAPQEILRALDIPFVVNQWWASIVAAKQQSRRYMGLLRERGYPTSVEPYSAQGLAATFDTDDENAPWGGLPKPDFVHAVLTSDATGGIFGNWAGATGASPYIYERSVDPRWDIATDWWADLPDGWDDVLEPARIDMMTAELRDVIARLEAATGRRFDPARFEHVMHLVNEQEDYYRRTRDLIARTTPAPIGIVDSMPATMVPQWHRGTEWARDAARAFHDEVAQRVADGASVVADERARLMFVGRGMWSEMGFYQQWEESHGAVFVWSMYLALAADGYIRRFDRGRDPMRALAARVITMGDELRMPSWAAPWHVHEARTHQVDGAVALADADPFVLRALRAAGIPVLELGVDNFNRDGSESADINARITAFIEGPVSAMADARRRVTA